MEIKAGVAVVVIGAREEMNQKSTVGSRRRSHIQNQEGVSVRRGGGCRG